jgi:myo-inositol-1(or 4)-monophosphatase
MKLQELRDVAERAIRAGMDVVARGVGENKDVAAVERAAEAVAIDVIREADPGTPVFGEVSGGDAEAERVWVVDPVDGTRNLARGDPFVAVTVALLMDGRPVVGATGCPFTAEVWSAAEGGGSYDRAGRLELLDRATRRIALDPAESNTEHLARWSEARARLAGAFGDVELRSAIALELAHVAAGAFDGLVQVGGSPLQDFAAGVLLVREAGGLVSGLDGRTDVWRSDVVIAGTPETYRDLRRLLSSLV